VRKAKGTKGRIKAAKQPLTGQNVKAPEPPFPKADAKVELINEQAKHIRDFF